MNHFDSQFFRNVKNCKPLQTLDSYFCLTKMKRGLFVSQICHQPFLAIKGIDLDYFMAVIETIIDSIIISIQPHYPYTL